MKIKKEVTYDKPVGERYMRIRYVSTIWEGWTAATDNELRECAQERILQMQDLTDTITFYKKTVVATIGGD